MYDVAINHKINDWVFAANADLQAARGKDVIEQRMITRLLLVRGWQLDPTNGSLGSRLKGTLRLPRGRAIRELPLVAREAIAPMRDVQVNDVQIVESPTDPREVALLIDYTVIDFSDTPLLTNEDLTSQLIIEIGEV